MQSGFFYGTIGIVESIINRIKTQMQENNLKIIATGGYATLIAQECAIIQHVDSNLTLNGLVCLYHEITETSDK